jgi:polysaccharide deacetylase 2 family uncharacterized protein YibQ
MRRLLVAAAATLVSTTPLAADEARIAIIIDDLGYRAADGVRAVELPGPVAVAVLPDAPLAATLARAAHAAGKQVLVHLPLQAVHDDGLDEPGSIMLDTTRRGFSEAFRRAVLAVPHASGVNNHRGSLLTRHPGHMRWLMEEIGDQHSWFFVDSYTTHHSVALTIAREHGIPAAKRDVFLDSRRDTESIEREFERLKRLARERGAAIGIGHPFPETLAVLEALLPRLEAEGIELVAPAELLESGERPAEYRAGLTPARLLAQP